MQHSSSCTRLAIIGFVALWGCTVCRADQVVDILQNGGAEQIVEDRPVAWYAANRPSSTLRMWLDTEHAHSGKACLAISNDSVYDRPTSNTWAQKVGFVPAGKTVRLGGFIRTEGAEAANICLQCWGPAEQRMIGYASTSVFRGTHEWTYAQAPEVVVPPGTSSMVVCAALTGKGRAFFDDLSLQIIGEPAAGDSDLDAKAKGRILRILPIVKDSLILAYMPSWSHGDVDNIAVANNGGGVRTLLAWQDPTPQEVSQSRLQFLLAMCVRDVRLRTDPGPVQMHEILEDWNEIIGWEKRPRFADEPVARFPLSPDKGWMIFDVTSIVRAWARTNQPHFGVVLRFAQESLDKDWSDCQFVSREGIGEWENRRPVLLVVDPNLPPALRPVATRPVQKPPVLAGDAFMEYIEYLASIPDIRVESVPGAKSVWFETQDKVGKAASDIKLSNNPADRKASEEQSQKAQIAAYEEFIQRYPLTPDGLQAMAMLGSAFARAQRYDDARRILNVAIGLGRNTDQLIMLRGYLAAVEEDAGNPDAAVAILRSLMSEPLPPSIDNRWFSVQFGIPTRLAMVLQRQGQYEQADKILAATADRAVRLAADHPEKKHPILSYALEAYMQRMGGMLEQAPDNIAAAERLAEQYRQLVPDYSSEAHAEQDRTWGLYGGPQGAAQLRQNTQVHQRMRAMKSAASQASKPASTMGTDKQPGDW